MSADQNRRTLLVFGAGLTAGAVLSAIGFNRPAQAADPLRIGVIGSGHIGGTIGELWVKAGHSVMFASRHPDELKPMLEKLGSKAQVGTPEEAITFGDAILLAVPYKAYPDISQHYAAALKGKILLDAGNATKARDGDLYDAVQANGIGITSAQYFPGARLVRAFNAANYKVFATEGADGGKNRAGGRMAIPVAGNDAEAVRVAEGLVRDAGFDPVVVGPLTDAAKFQMGAPAYGQDVTAPELREKLGLAK